MARDRDQIDLSRTQRRLDDGDLTFAALQFRRALAPLDQTATAERIAESLVGLGRISHARGDATRAVLYAEEALRHDSSNASARQLMADATSADQPDVHDSWRREADLPQL
jgi:hypothetical protein